MAKKLDAGDAELSESTPGWILGKIDETRQQAMDQGQPGTSAKGL